MTEFLTWNAADVAGALSDGEVLLMRAIIAILLTFAVYVFAIVIDQLAERYLNKRVIAYEANVIDAIEYQKENLPPGMECYFYKACGWFPKVANCKKRKCIECAECVQASLSEDEKKR